MATQNQGVSTTHETYAEMFPIWQRCQDAYSGEDAIHDGKETYLARLKNETEDDYKARIARTPFFNATRRTVSGLRGMLFRKSPALEFPESIKDYLKDIDLAGNSLDVFAQSVADEVLTTGRVGLLVDYPTVIQEEDESLTVAQVEAENIRPSIVKYTAENIRHWKTGRVGTTTITTRIVLGEVATTQSATNEFESVTIDRFRVLDLFEGKYRQRVYEKDENGKADLQIGDDIYPLMNNKYLARIPFFSISANDLGIEVNDPPLLDLINMNIHHYRVSANWEHGCHFSALPTLFITGYKPDKDSPAIHLGGTAANCLPNPDSKATFVETKGELKAISTNLTEKKSEMAVLGARMLEGQKASVEGAETLKTRSVGESSHLSSISELLSSGFTAALTLMAEWGGATGEVSYELIKDFTPAGITSQELTALVSSWQSGAISHEVLFENLKRGELIDSELSFEEEQARINQGSLGGAEPIEGELMPDVEQAEPFDMNALIEAIKAIEPPEIIVEAPVIDLTPLLEAIKALPVPQVNVPNGNNEGIQPIIINGNEVSKGKVIQFTTGDNGKINGAKVQEAT